MPCGLGHGKRVMPGSLGMIQGTEYSSHLSHALALILSSDLNPLADNAITERPSLIHIAIDPYIIFKRHLLNYSVANVA